MQLHKHICILLMLTFYTAGAQKFELGKVTVAELEEKEHKRDPSASAAIIFKNGNTKFEYSEDEGFVMVTTVKTKIKIYKKEGYEWATNKIRYYRPSNSEERITISDAATYNLIDGKIVKTKLKSDGEFNTEINRYWGEKTITMPNVKEGTIIEYEYTLKSPNLGKFRTWDFQTDIPVNYSEFKTFIPEYFIYNTNQKGYVFPKVSIDKKDRTITYKHKEGDIARRQVSASYSTEQITYQETQTTYTAENFPAMKAESFVNNIANYTSSITHELSMVKAPNTTLKSYATDWASVTKTIYEDDDFGKELKKTEYFETDITTLIKGLKSQEEIISAIFEYVKSNVKWNKYYGYSCNDGVKSAYKNKTGNVAEINLMLTAMLRYAGLNANPVLISTRDNGISFFPNRTAFNYVITAVDVAQGRVLLDATERYCTPDILPLRDLNWFGRLIRKDGTSEEVALTPKKASKEITLISIDIKTDGTSSGKFRRQVADHEALDFRLNQVGISTENYIESLENKYNGIEIKDYSRENEQVLLKPIMETFSFDSAKDVEIINGKIYFSPLFFMSTNENPFKQEKREYPVDFGYPRQSKYTISIDIPDGYTVESLPKPVNLVTGDEIGAFKYITAHVGDKIQIIISSEINTAIVSADYYEVLKDFFQKVIDKENEKIVLTKV